MVIHTSTMVIGWKSASVKKKKDSVREDVAYG